MTASTPAPGALVRPFTIAIPDSDIADLKQRLARTRWPDPETVSDWSQGVRLENAKSLIDYWERTYDWRRFESELNRLPHFLTTIDGLDIHFIQVKSKNPNSLPLILTHGWPGSIVEFLKLIGPLTDPVAFGGNDEDSFDVVIPSLPGFGFSQKPTETGWNVSRIATAWVELMERLGYENWAAQGGDWGAVVTSALGAMRPKGLLGIHLNTQYAFPAHIPDTLSPEERHAVDTLALYTGELGGSNHLQATKPETVGFALADSAAGQAVWIYEKFQSKTDNHGLAEDALSTDDMLDATPDPAEVSIAVATEVRSPVAQVRIRPVRLTVDVPPADHAALNRWCLDAAAELGVARVHGQALVRALLRRALHDDQLRAAITTDVAAARGQ